ncbi:MAG: hypothetical protein Q8R32_00215 [bacterium]|nr:hypothetical protein [bacterium]
MQGSARIVLWITGILVITTTLVATVILWPRNKRLSSPEKETSTSSLASDFIDYESPLIPDGLHIRFSYPKHWGDVSLALHPEDRGDPLVPRQIEFAFSNTSAEYSNGLRDCPGNIHVTYQTTQDLRDPIFSDFLAAPQRVKEVITGSLPLDSSQLSPGPALSPFSALRWTSLRKMLQTGDGGFAGIRYVGSGAVQDFSSSFAYEALLLSSDDQHIVEVSADLDCGLRKPVDDLLFYPDGTTRPDPPIESLMRDTFKAIPNDSRIAPAIDHLDTVATSVAVI